MAPTKLQDPETSINGTAPREPDEGAVISRVGGAIAEATERRASVEDQRQAARRAAVEIASAMLDASSAETAAHSDDVDVITEGIARRLGLSGQRLDDVVLAARLHDVGKLGIPLSIINKPGSLDGGEWKLMHRHTIIGEQILLAVPELRGVARLVRHSHERWDGGGYPDGLAGEEIPLGSRIVFCADAYHAIRSDRPYRKGRTAAEALTEVRACAGTQFDPAVVEALEEVAAQIRAARNGNRPRAARPRRLMALMLIISVGACGSAFARSGMMPEAKGPAGGGSSSTGSASAGFAAGSEPTVPGLDALNASRIESGSAMVPAIELLSVVPPALTMPVESPLGPGLAEGAVEDENVSPDTEGAPGSPDSDDAPGVRDRGRGIGRGKGKGKGRGAELGRGHQKAKAKEKASKSKGSSSGPPAHSSAGKAKVKGSSKGASNGKAKGSAGQAAGTAKQPKAPKAPKPAKPPKATAPSESGQGAGAPATTESTGSSAAAPGPGNSGNGNGDGGNGNGHG